MKIETRCFYQHETQSHQALRSLFNRVKSLSSDKIIKTGVPNT